MPNVHANEADIASEHSSKWKFQGTVILTNDVPIAVEEDGKPVERIHENRTQVKFKCESYQVIPRHAGKGHDELLLKNAVTQYFDSKGNAREWVHHHGEVRFGGGGQFKGGTQTAWTIEGIQ